MQNEAARQDAENDKYYKFYKDFNNKMEKHVKEFDDYNQPMLKKQRED